MHYMRVVDACIDAKEDNCQESIAAECGAVKTVVAETCLGFVNFSRPLPATDEKLLSQLKMVQFRLLLSSFLY